MIAPRYHWLVIVSHTARGSYTKSFDSAAEAADFRDQQDRAGRTTEVKRARGPAPKQEQASEGPRKGDEK